MKTFYKRIFALIGIVFLTFLPVMTPTVHAVSSWSGDPWQGSPWNGKSWDGSNLQWSGDSWNGNSWNGNSWNGNSWTNQSWSQNGWNLSGFKGNSWTQQGWDGSAFQGNSWTNTGWDGNQFQGNPWSSSGWSMYGFTGNPWSNTGWLGNGYSGNPWSNSGWDGNGNGPLNPWSNSGWNGNGHQGNPWSSGGGGGAGPFAGQPGSGTTINPPGPYNPSAPEQFYDTDEFNAAKYVWDNMMNAAIDIETNYPNGLHGLGPNGLSPDFFKGFMVDTIKLQLGDHIAVDLYDIGDTAYNMYSGYKDLEAIRQATFAANAASMTNNAYQISTASRFAQYGNLIKDSADVFLTKTEFGNLSSTWSSMGALSKLNFVASGVNAGLSAYKTGVSIGNAIDTWQNTKDGSARTSAIADIGANLGETLMSVGGVATAIPGGQALGAGLVIVGGGLFVVSKATKLVADNWDKITDFGKSVGNGIKNAGKSIAKGAKKVGSMIKGWFS
ncbi:hypothetical protein [Ornithinibacillus bavariensis]|nr:hypothetical protein [Ornithinibacillus sp.]